MCLVRFIVLLLVIVGSLNWGLWGVFNYDVIAEIFGSNTAGWARFIYTIIGLAGIYSISFLFCKSIYKCKYTSKHKENSCNNEDHKEGCSCEEDKK